jgi:hypothetical protein
MSGNYVHPEGNKKIDDAVRNLGRVFNMHDFKVSHA